jgi:hypothetical protein
MSTITLQKSRRPQIQDIGDIHFNNFFTPILTVSQKVTIRRQSKKLQIQGAQILRNEAYL